MIVALIERDNICVLLKDIDLLKDLHVNKIARQSGHTAIKAINNHWDRICESVLQIFNAEIESQNYGQGC